MVLIYVWINFQISKQNSLSLGEFFKFINGAENYLCALLMEILNGYALLCAALPGKVGKMAKIKLKVLYQGSFKEIAKRLKNNYFKLIKNQYLFSFFLGGATAPLLHCSPSRDAPAVYINI